MLNKKTPLASSPSYNWNDEGQRFNKYRYHCSQNAIPTKVFLSPYDFLGRRLCCWCWCIAPTHPPLPVSFFRGSFPPKVFIGNWRWRISDLLFMEDLFYNYYGKSFCTVAPKVKLESHSFNTWSYQCRKKKHWPYSKTPPNGHLGNTATLFIRLARRSYSFLLKTLVTTTNLFWPIGDRINGVPLHLPT